MQCQYVRRYDVAMARDVLELCRALDLIHVRRERQLFLHALPENKFLQIAPDGLSHGSLNVENTDGRSKRYELRAVTGTYWEVQARLLEQPETFENILRAASDIEHENREAFYFRCRRGTHRSVGHAALLHLVLYHQAKLVFHTSRTMTEAENPGGQNATPLNVAD